MKSEDQSFSLGKILALKKELFIMRIKKGSEKSPNFKDYKKKKKEVARILTSINNKRI
jgi:ribosomal protein L29